MNWYNSFLNFFKNSKIGSWLSFGLYRTAPIFNNYAADLEKLKLVFSNPAMLKVVSLQCDLFSLAECYVYDKDNNIIEDDPFLNVIKSPNPLQSKSQLLWDYMFWNMIGNSYLYIDSNIIEKQNNKLYFLENQKIDFPLYLEKNKDKLIFSDAKLKEILRSKIKYRYDDGSIFEFDLSKLIIINDLSNGVGNFYKGNSRIDALYKVISNSEYGLDAKNINVRYSGKFMVAGQADPNDVTKLPMGEDEKKSIEDKVNGDKSVHAVKSMIDIKRFVQQADIIDKLDKSFLADYFLIGTMYGIPRDVLEAYASSTYENQEKARASHVSYTLDPKANQLSSALEKYFGYDKLGKRIYFSWDHLPFTQVFEKDKVEILNKKSMIFQSLLRNGVSLDEINAFLDTNFKTGNGASNQT